MSSPANDSVSVLRFDKKSVKWALRTIAIFVFAAMLFLWILEKNRSFILLLSIALLFAIAMEPPVAALAKRGWRRGAATGLVLFGVLISGVAFLGLFGGILFSQASSLISDLPTIVTDLTSWVNSTFKQNLDPATIINQLNINQSQVTQWATHVAGGIFGVLSSVVGGVFQLLTFSLFAFYLSADGPRLKRVVGSWMQPAGQHVLVTIWDITVRKTGGFVVSKVIMALASATAHSLFFAAIGLPYWLPLGLITGITSQFIPTVGTYLGILIPVLFAAFTNPIDALFIAIFATVYQQFENYLLSPRLSKITMDIHPAIAFGSVIIFANLFGAIGAIVSIPLAAALVSIFNNYGMRYELIPELHDLESQGGKPTRDF
ncbi:MAG: AI-2E family transporter [Actinomycetes bacterium]